MVSITAHAPPPPPPADTHTLNQVQSRGFEVTIAMEAKENSPVYVDTTQKGDEIVDSNLRPQ